MPQRGARLDTERMESAAGTQPEAHVDVEVKQRGSRSADLVLTIVGLLLLIPAVLWMAWTPMWLGAVVSKCGGYPCNDIEVAGMAVAAFGPPVVWVIALVASIVLIALRRRASWVAPIAFLLAIGVNYAGAWLAQSGADFL